ncbi:MAG: hypothetical protein IJG40_02345 [Oscillospiraceae bacterium]|nr:hypothetical protein [Oscillospiraceae bacterium]
MPQGTATSTQMTNGHQTPLTIQKMMKDYCSAVTSIPVRIIIQCIFFSFFLPSIMTNT